MICHARVMIYIVQLSLLLFWYPIYCSISFLHYSQWITLQYWYQLTIWAGMNYWYCKAGENNSTFNLSILIGFLLIIALSTNLVIHYYYLLFLYSSSWACRFTCTHRIKTRLDHLVTIVFSGFLVISFLINGKGQQIKAEKPFIISRVVLSQ